eukprot:m.906762 g.906762  ORF g.906762 m.906762 type:complete len:349 (-) comp60082_c0_seq1:1781-2827(-)
MTSLSQGEPPTKPSGHSRWSLIVDWLGFPDLLSILRNCAVAREETCRGDIEQAAAGPLLLVLEQHVRIVLPLDIRFKVRQQAEPVAVHEERLNKLLEAVRGCGRKEASLDLVKSKLQLRHSLVVRDRVVALLLQSLQRLDGVAEDEHVLLSDLAAHFDVGAVQGANRQRAVQHELHVASARRLRAGGGNLLGQVRCRGNFLSQRDAVVLEEYHLQPATDIRVVVDHFGDGIDELDDGLGGSVAWRCLATKEHGARNNELPRIRLDAVEARNDAEDVEELALVLVDALHLHVEHALGIDLNALKLVQVFGKRLFVVQLDLHDALQEAIVGRQALELSQALQIHDPLVAN